jgi:hypothetical protein
MFSYSLAFLLLVAEMVTFCLIVAPLPYSLRKKLFRFLSESPFIAKIAYGVKIAFVYGFPNRHFLLLSLTCGHQFDSRPLRRRCPTHDAYFCRGRSRQDR